MTQSLEDICLMEIWLLYPHSHIRLLFTGDRILGEMRLQLVKSHLKICN